MKNEEIRPQHMSSFTQLVNSLLRHCLNVWPTLTKVTNCCSKSTKRITAKKITMSRCPFGTAVEVLKSVPSSVTSRVTKNRVLQSAERLENVGTCVVIAVIETS
jgi:hypothetical protein